MSTGGALEERSCRTRVTQEADHGVACPACPQGEPWKSAVAGHVLDPVTQQADHVAACHACLQGDAWNSALAGHVPDPVTQEVGHIVTQKADHAAACHACPQGEPWNSALAGHVLDPVTQEADQKRLMLERFQSEVRDRRPCLAHLCGPWPDTPDQAWYV